MRLIQKRGGQYPTSDLRGRKFDEASRPFTTGPTTRIGIYRGASQWPRATPQPWYPVARKNPSMHLYAWRPISKLTSRAKEPQYLTRGRLAESWGMQFGPRRWFVYSPLALAPTRIPFWKLTFMSTNLAIRRFGDLKKKNSELVVPPARRH